MCIFLTDSYLVRLGLIPLTALEVLPATLSKNFVGSHPSISDESSKGGRIRCLYGWYRISCRRNIRCGTSQAHAIKSKLFRKRRSCIYYIKAVSKSIPLPREKGHFA
ncbi:hypothetical protein BrnapMp054 (mitochondrion) [Brassica napus]|uniref:ORF106b n=13 Tax=Brassiceae TaxID=981071 RepID=Q6YSN8_BRANA|nr:orf106b [Brassica oleracea]YP_004927544.1 orf106b [Brassica carinata]YP_004927785.1 orf106b [Brassica juncea]YP_004927882.1 orf106b [Brassica rapa subsp. oleifera]YP_009228081.1 hypothetical protein AYB38_gp67 [Brassica nigra]YP_009320187.1 orf106 [Sinapis arvensis]YP_009907493.1 hypothetical protein [Brassica rapa]YP_717151.1 hypothetical protein BrnapMp054 [Brassica napus]AEX57667.1 hypothetical protein RasatMp036 [Raphanus sativus]AGY62768.1 orf106 [Eruca vesicaria subsp. sativa]AHY